MFKVQICKFLKWRCVFGAGFLNLFVNFRIDQSPKFFGGPYVFKVKENSPPGTKVGEISVQDGDVGNPRDLQIRLLDEAQNDYFRLSNIQKDHFTGTFSAIVETSENILDAEDEFIRENLAMCLSLIPI